MRAHAPVLLLGALAVSLAGTLATGCSGSHHRSANGTPADGSGTVNVQVTDAPYPFASISAATVTITEVALVGSGSQGFVTVFTGSRTFDLLALQNGIMETLVRAQVPAGSYDQMRIVISDGSVGLTDGRSFRLNAPSAQTAGIKVFINPPLQVVSGVSHDLLLDVDLSQSFGAIPASATNATQIREFQFHPVVRAANLASVGRITGTVFSNNGTPANLVDDFPLAGATVSVLQSDTVVGMARTSSPGGGYVVLGLPPGTYSVRGESAGFNVLTVNGRTVEAGSTSTTNMRLAPQGTGFVGQ